MSERHEMILDETYLSGAQEWYCPLCHRRLLVMNWHPDGRQIVINLGDEASHSNMGTVQSNVESLNNRGLLSEGDDARLEVWNAWLDEVDFDSWWSSPIG